MSENLNDALELKDPAQQETESQPVNLEGIKKYPVLQTVSGIYKVLAWITAIGALIGIIAGISLVGKRTGLGPGGGTLILYSVVYGIFGVIGCLAIAQGIQLFIDMAANSQRQVQLLSKLVDKQ